MTTSNFDKRLQIEQLRYIEDTQTFSCSEEELPADLAGSKNFEDRLWQRSKCLVKRHDLSHLLGRAARLSHYAKFIALAVAALLGILGTLYAVSDRQTINIYWLLLVLLGFNLVSMLFWLTGIGLSINALTSGALARLTRWLPVWLSSRLSRQTATQSASRSATRSANPQDDYSTSEGHHNSKDVAKAADRAWLSCHFTGAVGKWQLSKITHQLWLVYLLTGLAFLVLLLMVRQFDFIWGTTLLPDTAFIKLTEVLSAPLDAIGFSTPSAEQVTDTRIGLAQALTDEHRHRWAQFLLGALLCFGILPRLLLLLFTMLMTNIARRRFSLDYYLPYYVSLRQQLMPLASRGLIIDADTSPPVLTDTPRSKPEPHTLPPETQWVAVELGMDLNWTPDSISTEKNLGHVIDRASLSRVLDHLQRNKCPVIAVVVAVARPPDRGVQRTISKLVLSCEKNWLVLLQSKQDENMAESRLAAWYRLAEACGIPADHVISMRMS